ncbi:MAG: hypothetical protein ACR2RB_02915, partial [Gammaproteobacteria bacterium]
IFDSTTHFLLLGNTTCIPRFRKCVVKSNLCAIISPRGEKCGLATKGSRKNNFTFLVAHPSRAAVLLVG